MNYSKNHALNFMPLINLCSFILNNSYLISFMEYYMESRTAAARTLDLAFTNLTV